MATFWMLLLAGLVMAAALQSVWYSEAFRVNVYQAGGNYHEGSIGEIKTMNPLYASSSSEKVLSRLMFNGLVGADGDGGMSNVLAESIERSEDGKVWTVNLKPNLRWSDGEKLTVDDVVFTAGLIQNAKTKSVLSGTLSNVTVKKVNKKTIRFELASAYTAFIYSLDFPILPKHILQDVKPEKLYEDKFSKEPIGSGPFVLKSTQTSGDSQVVYLNRNKNYYRRETKLANFTLSAFKKVDDLREAVEKNTVMGTGDLLDVDDIKSKTIQKREIPLSGGVFAFFNTQSSALTKPEVRQAIRRGVNTKNLRRGIAEDWPLDYPILERQMAGLNYPQLPEYNRAEAIAKLAENELSGENMPTLRLATPARENLMTVTKRLAKQLEELGFKTKIVEGKNDEDVKDFFMEVVQSRDYDILVYEIDMGIDPDPYPYYSSSQTGKRGVNYSNLRNTMVDDLLLSARSTLNNDLRKTKYDKFLAQWVEQVPAIGIYQSRMNYYQVKNVKTFDEAAILQSGLDRYYDINDWGVERVKKKQTP